MNWQPATSDARKEALAHAVYPFVNEGAAPIFERNIPTFVEGTPRALSIILGGAIGYTLIALYLNDALTGPIADALHAADPEALSPKLRSEIEGLLGLDN
jgi:hypothetical protein